ncbi:hypothetical protein GCM10011380_13570 [Sphingomonas metalli]|uniref:DUF4440 domain-containing protein n=1 Tax=Sphingomonas metalli TaxID=1779358 RepID=A0A916T1Z2_9SPHN|nr:DUF4440 domain-containing protein [Sphingomonas metalli]GGB25290.1 hypothetical protein GCM10011380_13570 [Sphingomonas metalli]
MEDDRVRAFEESLWTGDADHYRELVDDEVVMVLPQPPYVYTGAQAIEAVANTPRWTTVELADLQIMRPQEGLIVIAYHARAAKEDGEAYEAHCTSTIRRLEHEVWRVVQHQQTPPLAAVAKA